MPPDPEPTDPARELELGRIALWLDPEDLRWIGAHCDCTDETPDEDKDRCARIRFRAHAALHKTGAKPAAEPYRGADALREKSHSPARRTLLRRAVAR